MNPVYFAIPDELRQWFASFHESAKELHAGYYKRGTGIPSITWPESVDEALCVGWIDGVRRSIDAERYAVRFTPRKTSSIWSAVNIRRVEALTAEGRMQPAGLRVFAARKENKSGIYAYEQRPFDLPETYGDVFRHNADAWNFFQAQAPSYRKVMIWWIISAKREETRLKRLQQLIEESARGCRLR